MQVTRIARPVSRTFSYSVVFGAIVAASAAASAGSKQHHSDAPDKTATVQVQMHGVFYHFTKDISVYIDALEGELAPMQSRPMPVFDDKNSFTLRIRNASFSIPSSSLAAVLNSHVFAASDSPLKDISLSITKDELKVKGKLHGKGDISFEMDGTPSATPDGKVRIHARSIRAFHLPVKGLMDLFGVQVASLMKTGKVPGVRPEKDDLILDPERIFPPPQIEGRVTGVHLQADTIVLLFGSPRDIAISLPHENYMQYEGNQLRFGKLTMTDTDLLLLDMDPKDPFDFFLDHYREQLVAGYTKTTPSFGLRVYMRDFNKLHPPSRTTAKKKSSR